MNISPRVTPTTAMYIYHYFSILSKYWPKLSEISHSKHISTQDWPYPFPGPILNWPSKYWKISLPMFRPISVLVISFKFSTHWIIYQRPWMYHFSILWTIWICSKIFFKLQRKNLKYPSKGLWLVLWSDVYLSADFHFLRRPVMSLKNIWISCQKWVKVINFLPISINNTTGRNW